jgi:hypothetical protein
VQDLSPAPGVSGAAYTVFDWFNFAGAPAGTITNGGAFTIPTGQGQPSAPNGK